ncbi:MAG: TatD family hydrolase [Bacteroidota bacterium]
MLIDTHAHLYSPEFQGVIDEVIARAREAGIEYIVVPAVDYATSRTVIDLAERYDMIYACVGFHPHDAGKATAESLKEIEQISRHPKVVAIGEIGLDYYYDFSPRETQVDVFREQLRIASRRNLPVVIHTRDSLNDAIHIVEETIAQEPKWRSGTTGSDGKVPIHKGVFHCYAGDAETAWKLIEMGFLISFPGIVTFKNSNTVDVLKKISYDYIMVETDAPYLTPVPFRGHRNEPANVKIVVEKIAEIMHATIKDVERTTSYNAKKLFGIGSLDPPRIVYQLKNALYINLTIRCNADCVFCDRKGEAVIKGHNLRITEEPTAQEVIDQIGDPTKYDEIVFCGYGEPTIRLDELKDIARWVKEHGGKVRINTDGHGSVINKRNIVPELVGLIDSVSISLNSTDPEQYGRLMRIDGPRFYPAMLEFARQCQKYLPEVVMSIVGMDEVDQEKAKEFVEKTLGMKYRMRPYF